MGGEGGVAGRPVSRVLSAAPRRTGATAGRSFLSDAGRPTPLAAYPRLRSRRSPFRASHTPGRDGPSLAAYLALLRPGFTVPPPLPEARWALTRAPDRRRPAPRGPPPRTLSPVPAPRRGGLRGAAGGLLSVALSVAPARTSWRQTPPLPGTPATKSRGRPGVTWRSALRSPDFPRAATAPKGRPSRDRPAGRHGAEYTPPRRPYRPAAGCGRRALPAELRRV